MFKHVMSFVAVAGLVFALSTAALATPIAPGNLMGYWTFDDDTVNDSSGNNYHGTTNGTYSTDVPPGLSGKSIDFAGNDYATVSTGGTEDVFDLDTLSVGFWVSGIPTWGSYVAKADNDIADGWMIGNFDNGNTLDVRMRGASAADSAHYGWRTTTFLAGT